MEAETGTDSEESAEPEADHEEQHWAGPSAGCTAVSLSTAPFQPLTPHLCSGVTGWLCAGRWAEVSERGLALRECLTGCGVLKLRVRGLSVAASLLKSW